LIKAEVVLENGLLKSCRISGHSGAGPKGADIVCAAVSALARTAHKTLSDRPGVTVRGSFPERGEFRLEIIDFDQKNNGFLEGVGTFLGEGLLSVSREFPDFCNVIFERCKHGS